MTTTGIDAVRPEVQGNVIEAYELPCVRHLVVRVEDAAPARAVLTTMLDRSSRGPTITSGSVAIGRHPGPFLNLGITYLGLRALGVPDRMLHTFPPEFREGMVARSPLLGDVGPSRPERWTESLRRPDAVHLIFTVHAAAAKAAARMADDLLAAGRGSLTEVGHFDGEALLRDHSGRCGLAREFPEPVDPARRPKRIEHFGFRDGLSQPRFEGAIRRRATQPTIGDPTEPLGIVLLGHPTTSPVTVRVPEPHPLGYQGSFSAFRVLAQDVAGFRRYVKATTEELRRRERERVGEGAADHELLISEELLKAKMCGRWPNGVPLNLAATLTEAEARLGEADDLNAFDFSEDQDGKSCPVGSHIRRSNPRNAHIVQRPSNRARRLVRRGSPFGPWLAEGQEAGHPRERGLLGSFLCASLSTQFETMQYEWINLGMQDPSITSTNDPLVGANDVSSSRFTLFNGREWETVQRLPSFVETVGGAYCFHPSMKAIEWLGSARWAEGAGR